MADGVKTRRYVSPRRDEQARETRRQIIRSAKRLFVDRGYGAARIEDIAGEAGVAVQTIYSAVGNKRDLLWAVLETAVAGDDEPATVEARFRDALADASGLDERLERAIGFGRRLLERSADVHRIMRGAAASDPDVATAIGELEARRRHDATAMVGLIMDRDRPSGDVVDFFSAITGYEVYEHLVERCGWPAKRYEEWVVRSLRPAFGA